METPGTLELNPVTPDHASDTVDTARTPQLIYTSKQIVDDRIKPDKQDQVLPVKLTSGLALVSVQQSEHSAAIHTEVQSRIKRVDTHLLRKQGLFKGKV